MAENLVEEIQKMLTEEKWTRATLANYSVNNFAELAELISKAEEQQCVAEIKNLCDEHLKHTKNSIIALYITGMMCLKEGSLDNHSLSSLLDIFVDNKKSNIVIFLCETILNEDKDNRTALRILAETYREAGKDKMWEVYEHLAKVDHHESDVTKMLAEKYEKDGRIDDAVEYYKKAMLRYINTKNLTSVKEIWFKLVALIPEETGFFFMVQKKLEKISSADKNAALLQELYNHYRQTENWDVAIKILKMILTCNENNPDARREITECYRQKYKNHSKLEDYIRISDLNQSFRNVFVAIANFEKHIAFDAKNYVHHRTWGVGRIDSISSDEIVINFGKKAGVRSMSLKMAVDSLSPLSKEHIWVLKAAVPREKLVQKVKTDHKWALQTVIRSFNNNCDFKKIKTELVPTILTDSEWTGWSAKARKILESDSIFGVNPNDVNFYRVRDEEIDDTEKYLDEFRGQKNFFSRLSIIMRFSNDNSADKSSEAFDEMFRYFTNYLKSFVTTLEENRERNKKLDYESSDDITPTSIHVLAAELVVLKICSRHPEVKMDVPCSFSDVFNGLPSVENAYCDLKDTKHTSLRADFLHQIKVNLPNWQDIYIQLFPYILQEKILNELLETGAKEKVLKLVRTVFENPQSHKFRELAVFFFGQKDEAWFAEVNLSEERLLVALISILEVTFKEIDFHRDTTENRKINTKIKTILFKNETLLNFLLNSDAETISRIYTVLDDVKNGEIEHDKMLIKNRLREKNPDIKFFELEEVSSAPKGMLVTAQKFDEKKQLLEKITKVDLPANAKEIGEARELGDLKENAEYKAARERQVQLSNQASRLQDEIERAVVFDPSAVTTYRISFGTKVTFENKSTGKDEKYTILGPWESDPAKGVISYMSPFGNAVFNAKEGDELDFEIHETKYSLKVKKIEVAKF